MMKATHIGVLSNSRIFFLGGGICQTVMSSNSNYGIEGHRRNDQLYGTLDR